jgi:hypothetical protein
VRGASGPDQTIATYSRGADGSLHWELSPDLSPAQRSYYDGLIKGAQDRVNAVRTPAGAGGPDSAASAPATDGSRVTSASPAAPDKASAPPAPAHDPGTSPHDATTTDASHDTASTDSAGTGEKLAKADTGSAKGVDPTPDSIRQGTVRMEDHPDFAKKVSELEQKGFKLSYEPGNPHVVVKEVVAPDGTPIRFEKSVVVQEGIRYLDFEHELGHVDQLTKTDPPMVTDRVLENGKQYTGGKGTSEYIAAKKNAILEYHNRIVEYVRLKANGADPQLLAEHETGVRHWREEYQNKGLSKGRGKSEIAFRDKYFPDLGDLEKQFNQAIGK